MNRSVSSDLPPQFTTEHVIAPDGRITFSCATDASLWPWLALPPTDAIVVQTLNFYALYEVSIARGHHADGQWTALKNTRWQGGGAAVGHAVRGVSEAPEPGSIGYHMQFFDENDALVYTMTGEGVVFRDRDFESWRRERKAQLDTSHSAADFSYAAAAAAGVSTSVESFLAPLAETRPATRALITAENGFLPQHPYHSGSGDHVNATHLADAGQQYLRLLHGEPTLTITGGSMAFMRYVELGCPFQIDLDETSAAAGSATLHITQDEGRCATLSLRYCI